MNVNEKLTEMIIKRSQQKNKLIISIILIL